jgi:hypothetical protein
MGHHARIAQIAHPGWDFVPSGRYSEELISKMLCLN